MTKPSKAYKTQPVVICIACQRPLPRISRQPMPTDLVLRWNEMQYIERRLLATLLVDHRRQPYREWRGMFVAELGNMKYRQVMNAIRRLAPTGWVHRVSWGLYRLTPYAVEQLAWVPGTWTITKIAECAQALGTEDTETP